MTIILDNPIIIECPNCHQKYKVNPSTELKGYKCKKCNSTIIVQPVESIVMIDNKKIEKKSNKKLSKIIIVMSFLFLMIMVYIINNSRINNPNYKITVLSSFIPNKWLAKIWYNKGVESENLGQKIEFFSDAIMLNPQYTKAYNNRGNAINNNVGSGSAISDYNKVIELDPQDANAYNNRGVAYTNACMYEAAILDLNKAIELNPQLATAYHNRGIFYERLGNHGAAIFDFEKAKMLNPQLGKVYYIQNILFVEGQYTNPFIDE
jgi:tetratricopeptide (TPR) repeat protein